MLWHIDLKFCIWLCFTVLQIKLECRQFASIFVGVMPLLESRILEIHSFPHFSLTSLNILNWKFAYYFIFLYYRSSLSVVNLGLLWSYGHSFPHFSPTCFDILIWNFVYHFIFMHVRSSLNAINFRHFLQELCSFLTSNSYKYAVFRTFLLHALTYWVQILYMTLF